MKKLVNNEMSYSNAVQLKTTKMVIKIAHMIETANNRTLS